MSNPVVFDILKSLLDKPVAAIDWLCENSFEFVKQESNFELMISQSLQSSDPNVVCRAAKCLMC